MRAGDRPPRCQSSARRDQSANRHAQGPSVRAAPRGQASDVQSGRATLRRPAPQRLALRRRHGHRARRAPSEFARWPSRGDATSTLEVPPGKGDKKEMAARSARLLSDHRRAASARDRGGEAEFAPSDSYCGRHDDHAWCRKFESAMHRETEISQTCGISGFRMARPGLEPGTPRFSVVRSGMAGRTQSLEPCDSPVARAPA